MERTDKKEEVKICEWCGLDHREEDEFCSEQCKVEQSWDDKVATQWGRDVKHTPRGASYTK